MSSVLKLELYFLFKYSVSIKVAETNAIYTISSWTVDFDDAK
jgi:hypothetical protein